MRTQTYLSFLGALCLIYSCKKHISSTGHSGWSTYAGSKDGNRYSSNNQITLQNVSQLKVAWTYSSADKDSANRSQVQPNYWLNPKNGIQYLVSIRVPEYRMDSIEALNAMPISANRPGKNDAQILANLATFERATGSPIFSHYNVMPVIDVFGGVSGRDLGGLLKDINPLIEEAKKELPKGSFIMLRGQADTMHSSYVGLGIGLVLAVVLVYLLLVVNFQSWLDPFIIIT
ncbi:efflux RND transporter permease subunit, partial [uncultured Mucilaginibacter sp.]|uniref:efflux RND transporter permease subunit n=1 Tax=uncultured Mucilaginibacter sp. TaxID=797541 RepID=UPI0025F73444